MGRRHKAPVPPDEESPDSEERGDPPSHSSCRRGKPGEAAQSSSSLVCPSYHNVVTWETVVMGDGFSSPLCPPGHSMRQGQGYGRQLGEEDTRP